MSTEFRPAMLGKKGKEDRVSRLLQDMHRSNEAKELVAGLNSSDKRAVALSLGMPYGLFMHKIDGFSRFTELQLEQLKEWVRAREEMRGAHGT